MLHQVTKPTPWMGGASLLATPEEDAPKEARIWIKFKEWHHHWQVGHEVQSQDKPCESLHLREQDEALAPLKVGMLRKAASACKVTTLDLGDECCSRIHALLHKVEMARALADQCQQHPFLSHPKKQHS